jgi:hypothetical protein
MRLVLFFFTLLFSYSCQTEKDYSLESANPEFMHRSLKKLTDVIVYDIFSPPVASRIYAYSSIAAYEVIRNDYPEYKSLVGQLNGLVKIPAPDPKLDYCFPLASTHALLTVGRALTFAEDSINMFLEKLNSEFDKIGVPTRVIKHSLEYGVRVADHIIEWSAKDNYKQTRTYPRFAVTEEDPSRWLPTPPDYMDGIEPAWSTIRTFALDSATQFIPPAPTEYNMTEGSQFYSELMEVYDAVNNLNQEQTEIAQFWDCNPYVSHHKGHAMFATKKVTPGGHWMGIAAIASRKDSADIMRSSLTYAYTSIALADAFISCWDEKYRSNLIRPVTLINQHIDERWEPLLQTPPFPEYTSGHSVISGAAAIMLTHLYGDNFAFEDTTEMEYGLPQRNYDSFIEASEEAAISRLYGGIHYMPAIINGVNQGRSVGRYVANKLKYKDE